MVGGAGQIFENLVGREKRNENRQHFGLTLERG